MCIKTPTNEKNYCYGCEFHCVLGTQRKLFSYPAKYYPTINSRKITEYTDNNGIKTQISAKRREYAEHMAHTLAAMCARNEHRK